MGDSSSERREQASQIITKPNGYKVCCGCGSIVTKKVVLCPNCHAYQYDLDSESVIARAKKLGKQERHTTVLPSDME